MTAIEHVCDIIQTVMGLPAGRVMLWDQKYNTPNDFDLFILVSVLSSKVLGSSRQTLADTTYGAVENIAVTKSDMISIDIMSRGTDARDRNWEIVAALGSSYAENQMAQFGFYVSHVPTAITALNNPDGAAIPYRFNVTVNLQYTLTKQNQVSYYDSANIASVLLNN